MTLHVHQHHAPCLESVSRALFIAHLKSILEDDLTLKARLDAAPDCFIHFALNLHSLEGDITDIAWTIFFDGDDSLTIADATIEDPWETMLPAIHMHASYSELCEHLGTIVTKKGNSEA